MPLVKIVGAAAIALLAAGNTLANAAENPARMAQEQHTCAVVMGLHCRHGAGDHANRPYLLFRPFDPYPYILLNSALSLLGRDASVDHPHEPEWTGGTRWRLT